MSRWCALCCLFGWLTAGPWPHVNSLFFVHSQDLVLRDTLCRRLQVCREADGFQRSLVSPEAGLRRLVHDSVETVIIPVDNTVRRVHQVLLEASK